MMLPTVCCCLVLTMAVSCKREVQQAIRTPSETEVLVQQAVPSQDEVVRRQQRLLTTFSLNVREELDVADEAEKQLARESSIGETFHNIVLRLLGNLMLLSNGVYVADYAIVSKSGSSVDQHRQFTFTSRTSVNRGRDHRLKILKVKAAIKRKGVPLNQVKRLLQAGFGPKISCDDNFICDINTPYRTADGSCNNLVKTTWGMASTPMRRWLIPDYDDGISSPRTQTTPGSGVYLPSARAISVKVHAHSSTVDQHEKLTYMLMQWGQYLDHDITSTPQQLIPNGPYGTSSVACCNLVSSGMTTQSLLSERPECFPIIIPLPDPHFTTNCMNFIRSVQVENANCTPAPAEQMNQITSYIDASNVYGSSKVEQNDLRTFSHGLLKIKSTDKLPEGPSTSCSTPFAPNYCFKAGDHRVNENPTLQSMHTIFMREHNRIAKELHKLNFHWNDEKLFQETRKIVGAIHQKITYGEYLPIVLGDSIMTAYGLKIATSGHTSSYSETTDAGIRNAFATAAFRFGHSMIRDHLGSRKTDYSNLGYEPLSSVFGNTKKILSDNNREVGPYCRGLAYDHVQNVDRKMSKHVLDLLFQKGSTSFDLAALNMQRGRDHGLPSYLKWRAECGVKPVVNDFKDLHDTHDASSITQLQAAYASVDMIDLFPGALSEKPVGGLVGPTFACLLARQFHVLKTGDRFWFEEKNKNVHFTTSQLGALREASLSRVVCDNTDTTKIQINAFKKEPLVSCSRSLIPSLNLAPWKENIGKWTEWSGWQCYKDGIMKRRRKCSGYGCKGPNQQSKPCKPYSEPLCLWSRWGPCNPVFDTLRTQYRQRRDANPVEEVPADVNIHTREVPAEPLCRRSLWGAC